MHTDCNNCILTLCSFFHACLTTPPPPPGPLPDVRMTITCHALLHTVRTCVTCKGAHTPWLLSLRKSPHCILPIPVTCTYCAVRHHVHRRPAPPVLHTPLTHVTCTPVRHAMHIVAVRTLCFPLPPHRSRSSALTHAVCYLIWLTNT